MLSAIYGCNSVGRMLALGASCPWFESKYPYLNGLCSVIRLAQDICNVLEEFKSHKVHTMFSCFHNVLDRLPVTLILANGLLAQW